MNGPLLAMLGRKVDVSPHLELATQLELAALGLLAAFFVLRPELWRRLWFDRVDGRPAALTRITFGLVVITNFAVLLVPHGPLEMSTARFLFTDEGMWLTEMARHNYGAHLRHHWDPDEGFQRWYDVFDAIWHAFSPLHLRSDPPFVFSLYALMLASLVAMVLGWRTRLTTIVAFVLVEWIYRYSPLFYTGGDTVIRVFLFLGALSRWGEAYSLDALRRRRKAIVRGASHVPSHAKIAAWPMRLMMLQLACIYCATGLLKSGGTWQNGTALYYALNLDHFYRLPMTHTVTLAHFFGVLPVTTVLVHWWEVLFPLALLGAMINAYERERVLGSWPRAAAWRRWVGYAALLAAWSCLAYVTGIGLFYFLPSAKPPSEALIGAIAGAVATLLPALAGLYLVSRRFAPRAFDFVRQWLLGKRLWLVVGGLMHVGIALSMNVGTFAPVMIAVYFVWLSGEEIDRFWAYWGSIPCAPGEAGRPVRRGRWAPRLLGPLDAVRHRKPAPSVEVRHHPGPASLRRAALLRLYDEAHRLRFVADETVEPERLAVRSDEALLHGDRAALAVARVLPAVRWLWLLRKLPGAGALALRLLRQRR